MLMVSSALYKSRGNLTYKAIPITMPRPIEFKKAPIAGLQIGQRPTVIAKPSQWQLKVSTHLKRWELTQTPLDVCVLLVELLCTELSHTLCLIGCE